MHVQLLFADSVHRQGFLHHRTYLCEAFGLEKKAVHRIDQMTDEATLSALVHGKQTAISFRHLSSLLNVSTRKAQALLRQFAESNPTATSLWCVTQSHPKTGVIRTSLTTKPSATSKKQIWAVGPPSAAHSVSQQAQWLAADAARDRKLVAEPSHIQNELRDGRWNRVKCRTSTWDANLDPRLGGDQSLACGLFANRANSKFNSSSLLASVKAKAKGKRTKAKGFMNGAFKPSSGTTSSLFSSKPLGADAVKKMRSSASAEEKENGKLAATNHFGSHSLVDDKKHTAGSGKKPEVKKKARKRTPSKQLRKIQDDDSDHEDTADPPPEEEEAEEDDHQEYLRELEREAAEKEKADAERAELEKEVMELNREDADEGPESPELTELAECEREKRETATPVPQPKELDASPGPGKRPFWHTFGDSPTPGKRIRKEVNETVEKDGCYETRRVIKVFDEHGNEVKESAIEKTPAEPERIPHMVKSEHKKEEDLLPKTPSPTNDKLSKSNLAKRKASDSKRAISKATKKTPKKKKEGSIMSYFGKKV